MSTICAEGRREGGGKEGLKRIVREGIRGEDFFVIFVKTRGGSDGKEGKGSRVCKLESSF